MSTHKPFNETEDNTSYKIVGYYENWSQWRDKIGKAYPKDMDSSKLTHLCYAFAAFNFIGPGILGRDDQGKIKYQITGDWKIQPVEWTDINEVPDPNDQQKTIAPCLYNQCTGYDQGQLDKFPNVPCLKKTNPNLEVFLSLGGWNFCTPTHSEKEEESNPTGKYTYQFFSQMAANQENRTALIASIMDFTKQYGFDGIDLDWEYPGSTEHGGTADDYNNYLLFLKELKEALTSAASTLKVTLASPAIIPSSTVAGTYSTSAGDKQNIDPQNPETYFAWLKECSAYLDWFNIMCYDYYGAFTEEGTTLPNAPVKEGDPLSSVAKTIQCYLDAQIDPQKIVMGIPSYGRTYAGVEFAGSKYGPGNHYTGGPDVPGEFTGTPGFLAYYEIMDQIDTKQWLIGGFDQDSQTPYAYNESGKRWVSYDNQDSIAAKVAIVKEKNLAGAMLWSLDDDAFQSGSPLLTKIHAELVTTYAGVS